VTCLKYLLPIAFAAFAAAPAAAQDIRDMDTSGDGVITKAEAVAVQKARFAAMDTNHDGKVTEDEFVKAGVDRLFALDTDGDGQVSRAELRKAFLARRNR
jgi:hypothetical protein